jgi:protein FrlC
MKLSTATSVFVNYPIEDAVNKIIQAGYDGIDLWCGRPHIYRKDHSPQVLDQLRHTLENNHIEVVSLMPAFFRYPYSLSSPNEIVRFDSIQYVKDCIDNALMLGAGMVLVVPTHSLHNQSLENARERFTSSLETICSYAEPAGIRLGMEVVYPRLSDYMGSVQDAIDLIKAVGSSCLGVVLDTGHLNISGEPVAEAIQSLGSLLFQVHVNDNDGTQQQNAIPGEGTHPFSTTINLLRQSGYDGFLTLELGWNYSFDPSPAVKESLSRLREFIAIWE